MESTKKKTATLMGERRIKSRNSAFKIPRLPAARVPPLIIKEMSPALKVNIKPKDYLSIANVISGDEIEEIETQSSYVKRCASQIRFDLLMCLQQYMDVITFANSNSIPTVDKVEESISELEKLKVEMKMKMDEALSKMRNRQTVSIQVKEIDTHNKPEMDYPQNSKKVKMTPLNQFKEYFKIDD